jgi:putative methionine-R-sulfoxide reductase with GAF domain
MNIEVELAGVGTDYERALRIVLEHFGAQLGTIHALGHDGMLHIRAHAGGIPEQVLAVTRVIPVGKGLAGLAVERKQPVHVCDLQRDSGGAARPGARATGAGGAVCVPMMVADRAVGALGIASREERLFNDTEVRELMAAGRELARHWQLVSE